MDSQSWRQRGSTSLMRVIDTVQCLVCGVFHPVGEDYHLCVPAEYPLLTEGEPLTENIWPLELGGEA